MPERVLVPASQHTLVDATYHQEGSHLVLVDGQGERTVVNDFFAHQTPPHLVTPDGAVLSGETAAALAGHAGHDQLAELPFVDHQLAQAGGAAKSQPIGTVDVLKGTVTATHVDGTKVVLAHGDQVFLRDLIESEKGGSIGIVFEDKTTFGLGEDGRMRLDELVYNPASKSGSMGLSVLKGAFVFVSGDIAAAQSEAMQVRTPVGTIGIRGTSVGGHIGTDGDISTITLLADPNGRPSAVEITNAGGTQYLTVPNQTVNIASFFTAPSVPFISSGAQLNSLIGAVFQELPAQQQTAGANAATDAGSHTAAPSVGPQTATDIGRTLLGVPHVTLSDPGIFNPLSTLAAKLGITLIDLQNEITAIDLAPPHAVTYTIFTLGIQDLEGYTNFDAITVPDSLHSGQTGIGVLIHPLSQPVTLTALYNTTINVDGTLTLKNIELITIILTPAANVTLDASGITAALDGTTITLEGSGTITINHAHDLTINGTDFTGTEIINLDPNADITLVGGPIAVGGGGTGGTAVINAAPTTTGVILKGFAPGTGASGGDDSLTGGSGADTFAGLGGHDTMIGGGDNDVYLFGNGQMTPQTVIQAGTPALFTSGPLAGQLGHSEIRFETSGATAETIVLSPNITASDGKIFVTVGDDAAFFNNTFTVPGADQGDRSGTTPSEIDASQVTMSGGMTIEGNAGNDTLIGSSNPEPDSIQAGVGGMNVLESGPGVVTLDGSTSASNVFIIRAGADFNAGDVIKGASVNDVIRFTSATPGDTLTLNANISDPANRMTVSFSTDSANTSPTGTGSLTGTTALALDAHLVTLTGGLVIDGNDGNDQIVGTNQNDTISVGTGNDTIGALVSGGSLVLPGGAISSGQDSITATGNGNDLFVSDISHLDAGSGVTIHGGTGQNELLLVGGGTGTVSGALLTGIETLALSGGAAAPFALTVTDTQIQDILSSTTNVEGTLGTSGSNTITLTNDVIVGGTVDLGSSGANTLNLFSAGGDSVNVTNVESIHGTGGNDTIAMFGALNGAIDLGPGGNSLSLITASNAFTTTNVETITGANGTDRITLTGATNVSLTDGAGNDTVVDNGTGNDTLTLGNGNDTVALANGTDRITIGTGLDTITVGNGNDTISVSGGTSADVITVGTGSNQITLANGNDTISIPGAGSDTITAGTGNDLITAGGADTISLVGGTGTDTITLGGGNDSVAVGTGSDVLTITAGGGNDTVSIPAGTGADTVALGNGTDVITLADGNDSILAGTGANTITVGNGNDTISVNGGTGADLVTVGTGSDVITLANGNDTVSLAGASGADTITVGIGADLITAANGNDTISVVGGSGDTISVGNGNDAITIGNGNDLITVGTGNDTITVGNGNDTVSLAGASGADTITVGTGADLITAANGNDTISVVGGAGDTISVGNGNDAITIGDGADQITVGTGADTISAGNGNDTISVNSGTGADSITVGTGTDQITAANGNDTIVVSGGTANDQITVGTGSNQITLANGNDTISIPGAGSDTITAGTGSDLITAGNGNDTISLGGGIGTDTITLGTGDDSIAVGTGSDVLTITAGGGNDTVSIPAGTGADTVALGNGTDVITLADGNDSILAGTGANTISAGNGNDTISVNGGAGADSITVGTGSDAIALANGNDTVSLTGAGSDTITVGTGADLITAANGNDTISVVGGSGDTVTVGDGNDAITIANASDLITVGIGLDMISFGSGNDTVSVTGGTAADTITGGAGNDLVYLANGDDALGLGTGTNTIVMGSGHEQISVGVGGHDFFVIGAPSDYNSFDIVTNGVDTLRFTDTHNGDTLLLSGTFTSVSSLTVEASDSLGGGTGTTNLELDAHLVGQSVSLIGNAGNDTLIGAAGFSDTIAAGGGNNQITGSTVGNDSVTFGGTGNDTMLIGAGSYYTGDTVTGSGALTIEFTNTSTTDTLTLNNHLSATGGLTIESSSPTSANYIEFNASAVGQSVSLIGNAGDDTLIGAAGFSDTIIAGAGANSIVGSTAGNDSITVNDGSGAAGNDTITTGSGNDTVAFTGTGGGADSITVGLNATVEYASVGNSTYNNLNQILNWTDTMGGGNEQLNLSAVTSQASISNQGMFTGPLLTELGFAFGGDAAGALDYAVINGETYVHVGSGNGTGYNATGYSASDLLIEINGSHTLTTTAAGIVHAH